MSVPVAHVLSHHPRHAETGVLLTARVNATGGLDLKAWMEACQRRDVEALEFLMHPDGVQFRYPIAPSAWTARDLRRVTAIMAVMIQPTATELQNLIWDREGLLMIVRPPWGRDCDPHPSVSLRVSGVPLAAVMELTGGAVSVSALRPFAFGGVSSRTPAPGRKRAGGGRA